MPLAVGPMLLVFNKLDQVDSETLAKAKEEYPLAVFIAAKERLGLATLREKLRQLTLSI